MGQPHSVSNVATTRTVVSSLNYYLHFSSFTLFFCSTLYRDILIIARVEHSNNSFVTTTIESTSSCLLVVKHISVTFYSLLLVQVFNLSFSIYITQSTEQNSGVSNHFLCQKKIPLNAFQSQNLVLISCFVDKIAQMLNSWTG